MGSSLAGGGENSTMGSRRCMGGHVEEDAVEHLPLTGRRHLEVCDCVLGTVVWVGACWKLGWALAKEGPLAVQAVGRRMHLAALKCHVQQGNEQCHPDGRHAEPVQV
eukprot:5586024-Amphidinium_carterae.2